MPIIPYVDTSSIAVFSPEQLAKAISDTMPLVPSGHTNAIIGTVDATGAQFVITAKLSEGWTISGLARHDWAGENQVGASVVYSW